MHFYMLNLMYVMPIDFRQYTKWAPISECSSLTRNKLLVGFEPTCAICTLDFKSNECTIPPRKILAVCSFVVVVEFESTIGFPTSLWEKRNWPLCHTTIYEFLKLFFNKFWVIFTHELKYSLSLVLANWTISPSLLVYFLFT